MKATTLLVRKVRTCTSLAELVGDPQAPTSDGVLRGPAATRERVHDAPRIADLADDRLAVVPPYRGYLVTYLILLVVATLTVGLSIAVA